MHRKFFHLLVIISLALGVALAQQPAPTSDPNVDRLRGHIDYLASDKLAGRRTGSPGANLAAEYIAREFARYGLRRSVGVDRPGMSHLEAGSPRRYMQEFPYVAGVELGNDNVLSIRFGGKDGAVNLRVGEDWMPLGFSSNARVETAEAVFVGYGITAAELNYDDYSNDRTRGKIAIALSGTSDGDNPHGQFERYEGARWKAIAARNAGAKALIIVARGESFKDDRLAQLRYDNSAGEAGIPVLTISQQVALHLFGADSMTFLISLANDFAKSHSQDKSKAIGNPVLASLGFASSFRQLSIDLNRREVSARNVIGILDGSDPSLKNETIVIGSHYDHLGLGGEGSLAPKEGEIHHGADDNASGTAGMLELARLFAAQRPRPRRTIVFIAFSGEEEGLLGSNYYVNHAIVPLANTVAMINMDMIGRMKNRTLIVGGIGTASEWRSLVEAANLLQGMTVTATGVPARVTSGPQSPVPIVVAANGQTIVSSDASKQFQLTLNEDGFGPSDHSSFYAKQVPVLFFWTGTHEDYHKPSDTADKINYDDEARILSFVARLVRDIDTEAKRPAYAVTKSPAVGRSTGFSVSLGTIPNYADSNDGLLLDGVRDDSPAAKAGIKAGDRIVKLAGRDVRNVYDYTAALGEMKAGQEYDVELMRGGERLKLKIIPAARK